MPSSNADVNTAEATSRQDNATVTTPRTATRTVRKMVIPVHKTTIPQPESPFYETIPQNTAISRHFSRSTHCPARHPGVSRSPPTLQSSRTNVGRPTSTLHRPNATLTAVTWGPQTIGRVRSAADDPKTPPQITSMIPCLHQSLNDTDTKPIFTCPFLSDSRD